jgi:hypothetical protein
MILAMHSPGYWPFANRKPGFLCNKGSARQCPDLGRQNSIV